MHGAADLAVLHSCLVNCRLITIQSDTPVTTTSTVCFQPEAYMHTYIRMYIASCASVVTENGFPCQFTARMLILHSVCPVHYVLWTVSFTATIAMGSSTSDSKFRQLVDLGQVVTTSLILETVDRDGCTSDSTFHPLELFAALAS